MWGPTGSREQVIRLGEAAGLIPEREGGDGKAPGWPGQSQLCLHWNVVATYFLTLCVPLPGLGSWVCVSDWPGFGQCPLTVHPLEERLGLLGFCSRGGHQDLAFSKEFL